MTFKKKYYSQYFFANIRIFQYSSMLTGISHTGDFKSFLPEQQYSPTCLSFTPIESDSKSSRNFHSCCSFFFNSSWDAAKIPNAEEKHTLCITSSWLMPCLATRLIFPYKPGNELQVHPDVKSVVHVINSHSEIYVRAHLQFPSQTKTFLTEYTTVAFCT